MASLRYKQIFPLVALSLLSCHAHKSVTYVDTPPEYVKPPVIDIPLPNVDFQFLLPEPPELATIHAPRKDITETLTARDKSHVKAEDPKRFADGDTEILDLSLIPREEYAFPLPGAKVISPYGGRRKWHSGVDLKTRANDTIVAAFEGIVRMAKPYAAYGNVIVIRHYNGLETVYSHNSKNLVKPGDHVRAGQPIALTGRTGRATTEHLHFETRINGDHFNPNVIFNLRRRTLRHRCIIFTKKGANVAIRSVDLFPHQRTGPYHP